MEHVSCPKNSIWVQTQQSHSQTSSVPTNLKRYDNIFANPDNIPICKPWNFVYYEPTSTIAPPSPETFPLCMNKPRESHFPRSFKIDLQSIDFQSSLFSGWPAIGFRVFWMNPQKQEQGQSSSNPSTLQRNFPPNSCRTRRLWKTSILSCSRRCLRRRRVKRTTRRSLTS